jgi:hypothetical protein
MEGSRKILEPALGYCWMCNILFIMHSLNHTLCTLIKWEVSLGWRGGSKETFIFILQYGRKRNPEKSVQTETNKLKHGNFSLY